MAAKKVFVDLEFQTGSNVNIRSNLSVTGTSTLTRANITTASLGQTILQSENYSLLSTANLNISISPQTTSLYLTGGYTNNEYSILSIAPTSGSFASGKILDVYNFSAKYVNIGASTYGNGANSIIYNWSEESPYLMGNTGFSPIPYWNNNNSNITYGGMLQIKHKSSVKLIYGRDGDNFWRILTTSSPYPSRIEVLIDTQDTFYTNSVSEVNVIVNNPFDNTNKDFTVSIASNSYTVSPSATTLEEIECIKKYTNDSSRSFNLTFNKSTLEAFRGSNRYIIIWIVF